MNKRRERRWSLNFNRWTCYWS